MAGDPQGGFTLVELMVASAMGVVLMAAVGTLVIGAVRHQPEVSKRAENISTARWVLERITREIRNGVVVDTALPDEVSFRTYVRHPSCGSAGTLPSSEPAILCQVTYSCTGTTCRRDEVEPEKTPGFGPVFFSGLAGPDIFSYSPNNSEPTYIGVTLRIRNPRGPGDITISDGASLRNAILGH
ncbi:MAG TPA: prepilin-type N-terminal cleavage/methylation domain-containing protein [Solirubrobacterales bacterium]